MSMFVTAPKVLEYFICKNGFCVSLPFRFVLARSPGTVSTS